MTNQKRRSASKTIEEYSQSVSSDGVLVRAKCYRVVEGERARLEILLDAAGEKAMVDLPAARASRLQAVVKQAAIGFAASIAARLDSGRL